MKQLTARDCLKIGDINNQHDWAILFATQLGGHTHLEVNDMTYGEIGEYVDEGNRQMDAGGQLAHEGNMTFALTLDRPLQDGNSKISTIRCRFTMGDWRSLAQPSESVRGILEMVSKTSRIRVSILEGMSIGDLTECAIMMQLGQLKSADDVEAALATRNRVY